MELIEKYYGKPQWRNIYEVICEHLFENSDYCITKFLKHCKRNVNIL